MDHDGEGDLTPVSGGQLHNDDDAEMRAAAHEALQAALGGAGGEGGGGSGGFPPGKGPAGVGALEPGDESPSKSQTTLDQP